MIILRVFLIILVLFILCEYYSPVKINIIKVLKPPIYNISINRDNYIHKTFSKKYLKNNSKILIFGCGLNTYSEILKKEGHTVVSLDIVDQSISSTPVVLYNGSDIPSDIGLFDCVIISTVLHHINKSDHIHILESIKKITKSIIVIEDKIQDYDFSYIKTSINCAISNFSFINRYYNFETKDNWLKLFNRLTTNKIEYQTDGMYELYFIKLSDK